MVVSSSGEVRWKATFDAKVWCDAIERTKWPSDVHLCEISYVFEKDKQLLQLKYENSTNDVSKFRPNMLSLICDSFSCSNSTLWAGKF